MPISCSFGCVLLSNQIFIWSDLSDQSALEIRVRIRVRLKDALFEHFFTENKESEHLIFREFHGR